MTIDGVRGVRFAVWAPNARRVSRGRRVQPLGRPPPPDAAAPGAGRLGAVRPRPRRRHALQVRAARTRRRAAAAEGRSRGRRGGGAAGDRLRGRRAERLRWTRRPAIGRRGAGGRGADLGLRGACRLLAARQTARATTGTQLAERLVPYVASMGFTHVELMPIMEHPFGGSWGYQPLGQFAPSARLGPPAAFAAFVDRCHASRHRRHPRLGAGAFPDRCARPRPLRRHAALRARRPARGLPPRLEHLHLQSRPQRGARLPDRLARCTGWSTTTSTGCAWMRSPRCCTATTAVARASGCRTATAGARTSKPCRSCKNSTR